MRAFGMVVINMPVMMLIVYSTIIAVMWFGGKMVYAGTLPVGELTAFFTYITQIMMSLDDGLHDVHDDDPVHRLRQADRGGAG